MSVWLCFDFITHIYLIRLTPLMPCLLGFETLWKSLIWLNYLLSSEGLSETFIRCKTFFRSASLFQMSKQISYAMCHAMYDCARMKCPSIFLNSFFPFSSFLILTNAKCKCHVQMPWLVLPMRYAAIVPQYVIDKLLTTDLDVNFLWMQTKHNANLDFLFLMQMPFIKMQMRNVCIMHMSLF